jgi:hypothetical protein
MERNTWKVVAAFCFFAARHILLGAAAIAIIMAVADASLERAAVGVICLIAAHILRPQNYGRILNVEQPPDAP